MGNDYCHLLVANVFFNEFPMNYHNDLGDVIYISGFQHFLTVDFFFSQIKSHSGMPTYRTDNSNTICSSSEGNQRFATLKYTFQDTDFELVSKKQRLRKNF